VAIINYVFHCTGAFMVRPIMSITVMGYYTFFVDHISLPNPTQSQSPPHKLTYLDTGASIISIS